MACFAPIWMLHKLAPGVASAMYALVAVVSRRRMSNPEPSRLRNTQHYSAVQCRSLSGSGVNINAQTHANTARRRFLCADCRPRPNGSCRDVAGPLLAVRSISFVEVVAPATVRRKLCNFDVISSRGHRARLALGRLAAGCGREHHVAADGDDETTTKILALSSLRLEPMLDSWFDWETLSPLTLVRLCASVASLARAGIGAWLGRARRRRRKLSRQ